MKISKIRKGLILVTISVGLFAMGCELIVDFDRTKIPVESVDSSLLDANTLPTGEAGTDAQPSDEAGLTEAGSDDGGDGGSDAADANDADG